MRIGIDARPIESDKPTGIGIYLANLLEYFAKNDSTNEYYLFVTKEPSAKLQLGNNFHIAIIPGKIGTTWVRYALPKYLKKYQINTFWGPQHMLPKKVKNIKYVLTVHDIALMINKNWGSRKNVLMQNIFAKPSIKQADKIIAISESTKNDLINVLKIDKNRICVVYNGVDKNEIRLNYETKIPEFDYKNVKKYFFYVGTIEPRKNIENLIKAFDNFMNAENRDYHLVIAGGLGWKYDGILAAYNTSKNKDSIHFVGYLDLNQKSFLYTNCTAFAFPTNYEGFGLPVLEAMSYGKPVISSNVSSIPEIGGDLVFYCNPKDIDSITKQMEAVDKLSKYELDDLSKKEKEHFKQFSWEKCGEQTLKEITTITNMDKGE